MILITNRATIYQSPNIDHTYIMLIMQSMQRSLIYIKYATLRILFTDIIHITYLLS